MLSVFISAISHTLSGIAVKKSEKWEDKKILEEEKENYYLKEVKLSKSVKKGGSVWFGVFLFLFILSVVLWLDDMKDTDMFLCMVLFFVVALTGVYILLLSRNYYIAYTDTFLEKTDAFGRKHTYRWDELKQVRKKGAVYYLFFLNGKTRFPDNKEYIGSSKLAEFIETITNDMNI